MASPVRVVFLGGLGEIGRNCMAVEHDGKVLLIDCGLMFPDADMHGIDLVLPDFSYLRDNAERIVGCVATHGHEDHTGALPYVLPQLGVPVYATKLTQGLIRVKLKEHRLLPQSRLKTVEPGEETESSFAGACWYPDRFAPRRIPGCRR